MNKIEMKPLPEGWLYSTEDQSKLLWQELQTELPEEHTLYKRPVEVVARASGNDDILCQYLDDVNHYVVVHLTWSRKQEININFPTVIFDGSFEDFIDNNWN